MHVLPRSLFSRKSPFFRPWEKIADSYFVNGSEPRTYVFALQVEGEAGNHNRVFVAFEDLRDYSLSTNSTLWRVAEIKVERRNEWLIFSREQDDLSRYGLEDFLNNATKYRQHLQDEGKRLSLQP